MACDVQKTRNQRLSTEGALFALPSGIFQSGRAQGVHGSTTLSQDAVTSTENAFQPSRLRVLDMRLNRFCRAGRGVKEPVKSHGLTTLVSNGRLSTPRFNHNDDGQRGLHAQSRVRVVVGASAATSMDAPGTGLFGGEDFYNILGVVGSTRS